MHQLCRSVLAYVLPVTVLALAVSGQISAAELHVDFGHNDIETGFQGFSQPGGTYGQLVGNTVVGPIWQVYSNDLGTGGNLTVTLSAAGGDDLHRLQSFYGGDLDSGVAFREVGEDCVYNIQGDTLDLTLDTAKSGAYHFTTFLHSSYGSQGMVDIDVIDAAGQRRVASNFVQSYATAGPVAQASGLFVADGANPVTIHFSEVPGAKNVVLAGVSVTEGSIVEGPLKVDFGHSDVEAGFEHFHTPGGPDTGPMSNYTTDSPVQQEFLNTLGTNDLVTVTLASGGRATTHRLQSFHSGEMGGDYPYRSLGKDIIYNLGDDWLDVTLSDLDEGNYEVVAFLHSSYSAQGDVNIDVTDRYGTRRVWSDFTQSHDANGPVAQAPLRFSANGIDDVLIRLTETPELPDPSSRNVVMAGFTLTAVPEPSSLVLLGLGAIAFVWRVRRWRR